MIKWVIFIFFFQIIRTLVYQQGWIPNRVASLVIVFVKFTHITSLFWSRDKLNKGEFASFTNRTREGQWVHEGPILHNPDPRWVSGFHLFCCIDFSVYSSNACDSCIAKGGNCAPDSDIVQFNIFHYNGNECDSMKKLEKQSNPKLMNLL